MGVRHVIIVVIVAIGLGLLVLRNKSYGPAEGVPAPVTTAAPVAPADLAKPAASPAVGQAAAVAAQAAPAASAAEASGKKLEVLKEILESKNDNDPRLDTEFRELDPALKARLQEFYHELPSEKLNSRGTVVFLLGRNIRTNDDARFMNSVLRQAPCLSLTRCGEPGESDPEASSDVTLAYPQIVATVGLVKGWSAITDPARRDELLESLKAAAGSPNPALARSARAALESIKKGQR